VQETVTEYQSNPPRRTRESNAAAAADDVAQSLLLSSRLSRRLGFSGDYHAS